MNILWGQYKAQGNTYEGPWTKGVQKFTLSESPSEAEKVVAVITATEGGTYDAVNMYDSCLWTVGVIQWCNRAPMFLVDRLMAAAAKADPDCLRPLTALAAERGYRSEIVNGEILRFYQGQNMIDTPDEQKRMYFLNSTGLKGTWDPASKTWAQRWLTASVQVWESEKARQAHLDFTLRRLSSFAYEAGKTLLSQMPDTDIGRAWRAMYLSFAANNPSNAAKAVANSLKETAGSVTPWSKEWLANMALHLTTDSGVVIYPIRYNAIRPVIERLYGVDLPDHAADLKKVTDTVQQVWLDPKVWQLALITLGYDVGPSGADGIPGKMTIEATKKFEVDHGVPAEFQDGMLDQATVSALEKALEAAGVSKLG